MKKFYYTPGPSELYFSVEKHIREGLRTGVGSINHRSEEFHQIFERAVHNLRKIFNLTEDHEIVFLNSASEIMERIVQNTVKKSSFHIVNGAFAERFYKFSKKSGYQALKHQTEWGDFPDTEDLSFGDTELIAITINETSTGVSAPLESVYNIKKSNPEKLIALDIVSSAPYDNLDFRYVDMAFFSVQKCFGLPPGLGVWIVNRRTVERSEEIHKSNPHLPAFHNLPSLISNGRKFETTETPNSLGIYLLARVTEDMLTKGIDQIRREINYKAAVLYHAFENSPIIKPFVKKENLRSKTVIVGQTRENQRIIDTLNKRGILIGKGYGKFRENHIRISNFPTHSKEQVEQIADILLELK